MLHSGTSKMWFNSGTGRPSYFFFTISLLNELTLGFVVHVIIFSVDLNFFDDYYFYARRAETFMF